MLRPFILNQCYTFAYEGKNEDNRKHFVFHRGAYNLILKQIHSQWIANTTCFDELD